MRNLSHSYQAAAVLAIALATLWLLNLSGSPDKVSNLLSKSLLNSETESGFKQQITVDQTVSHSETVAKTSTLKNQPIPTESSLVNKVVVWGTIQTEYGEITSFDQIVFYSRSLGKVYTTHSKLNGYFYIDGIQPARDYRVRVNPAGMYHRYVRRNLDLSADQTGLAIVLQALPLETLRGRVVSRQGIAMAGIGLRVKSALKTTWSSNFVTNASGEFEIVNVPLGELEFSSTFGREMLIIEYPFEGDSGSLINLVVDQGNHKLNGLVQVDLDDPLVNASVTLSWTYSEGSMHSVVKRHTRTDVAGRFSVHGLGSGEYELLLVTPAGISYRQVIEVDYTVQDITINLAQSLPSN